MLELGCRYVSKQPSRRCRVQECVEGAASSLVLSEGVSAGPLGHRRQLMVSNHERDCCFASVVTRLRYFGFHGRAN